MTPQQDFVQNLYYNFQFIQSNLHANTIMIRLADQDGFHGQYGGGWSYNPGSNPPIANGNVTRPDSMIGRAIAQELILTVASLQGLKVIFVINPSAHHEFDLTPSADGTFADDDPDENPNGSWDFIHQFFDPLIYYPNPVCSGDLSAAGVPGLPSQVCINNPYYSDPRVTGWFFSPNDIYMQADGTLTPAVSHYVNKYWDFFYSLVHWNGSNTGFAGMYSLVSAPESQYNSFQGAVDSFKAVFVGHSTPDVFGFGWYGDSTTNIKGFIDDSVSFMSDGAYYNIPPSRIFFVEGADSTVNDGGVGQFYSDSVGEASATGTLGLAVWEADGYGNQICGFQFDSTFNLVTAGFSPVNSSSCILYPSPGWHFGGSFIGSNSGFTTLLGQINYTGLTTPGNALASQFQNH
jgi:hypothetical protein